MDMNGVFADIGEAFAGKAVARDGVGGELFFLQGRGGKIAGSQDDAVWTDAREPSERCGVDVETGVDDVVQHGDTNGVDAEGVDEIYLVERAVVIDVPDELSVVGDLNGAASGRGGPELSEGLIVGVDDDATVVRTQGLVRSVSRDGHPVKIRDAALEHRAARVFETDGVGLGVQKEAAHDENQEEENDRDEEEAFSQIASLRHVWQAEFFRVCRVRLNVMFACDDGIFWLDLTHSGARTEVRVVIGG